MKELVGLRAKTDSDLKDSNDEDSKSKGTKKKCHKKKTKIWILWKLFRSSSNWK